MAPSFAFLEEEKEELIEIVGTSSTANLLIYEYQKKGLIEKIKRDLGWYPETPFEVGIKKTIKWYLDNKEWWETIISGEYQNYYEKMYANR